MFRKYYGRWISAFKGLPYHIGMHAMGTDVFGEDWNQLYRYLVTPPSPGTESSPVFLAGDFGRFDTSHSGWKMRLAFKAAAGACSDKEMCEKLSMSISRFGLRYRDREFKVPAGLPSGCQMTTPINCVLNTLVWLTVWRKATGTGLSEFMRHTRLITYGDDVVWSIDRNNGYFKYLGADKIQRIAKTLGYDLESADSGAFRWVTLDEVTFLKRRFVPDPRKPLVVHAPRDINDIFTQLMWRRSDANVDSQECCFRAFAAEVGQYPEKEYTAHINTILDCVRESKSPMLKEAFSKSNALLVARKSHNKQLELGDIARLRNAFWKLW